MQQSLYFPISFSNEEFKLITNDIVEGVEPNRYLVSNYGKIFDLKYNRYIPYSYNNGYIMVSLHTIYKKYKTFILHRIVAKAFIQGNWELQVNHIDGAKSNCSYYNLEWCTARENLMHALDLGLNKSGEDKPNAALSNDQVLKIAEGIVSKLSKTEIRCLSANDVIKICQIFQNDPSTPYTKIISELGLDNTDKATRRKILNAIGSIKLRKAYNDISCNYNW